jgi:hypothetical protein
MPFGCKTKPVCAKEDDAADEDGLFHPSFARKPLLFLHIPKTAGTSFRVAVMQRFGGASKGAYRVAFDYGDNRPETHEMVRRYLHAEAPDDAAFRDWLTSPWTKVLLPEIRRRMGQESTSG